jgi:NADPH:quinone reductase-like Zn-dependent oxidoreductase
LQFAPIAGAKILATPATDETLARMEQLGRSGLINYRARPDRDHAVPELTEGTGVDRVIEVGGEATLQRSPVAAGTAGHVSLIGRLSRVTDRVDPRPITTKSPNVQGIYADSIAMVERMIRRIAASGVRPVIGCSFIIDDALQCSGHLQAARHFGKVVIVLRSSAQ